tara:strand:- start:133 stop:369 length:237 start_codon:yes stop_codon:yes gene_type:complete
VTASLCVFSSCLPCVAVEKFPHYEQSGSVHQHENCYLVNVEIVVIVVVEEILRHLVKRRRRRVLVAEDAKLANVPGRY